MVLQNEIRGLKAAVEACKGDRRVLWSYFELFVKTPFGQTLGANVWLLQRVAAEVGLDEDDVAAFEAAWDRREAVKNAITAKQHAMIARDREGGRK